MLNFSTEHCGQKVKLKETCTQIDQCRKNYRKEIEIVQRNSTTLLASILAIKVVTLRKDQCKETGKYSK